MTNLEREAKFRLASARDYETLCAGVPGYKGESFQENTYWDYADARLAEAGVILRLRVAGEHAHLTRKGPAEIDAGGVFTAPESEEPVPIESARSVLRGRMHLSALDSGVLRALEAEYSAPARELRIRGSMSNLRRRYEFYAGTTLEVDRTEFPGGAVEWEVEVEALDARRAGREVEKLLRELGLAVQPQTKSKSERLRDYLRDIAPR